MTRATVDPPGRSSDTRTRGTALAAWEARLEVPLTLTAVAFLIAYAVDVLEQPHGAVQDGVQVVIWATWAVFAVDYVARLLLARERWHWFFHHLLDFATVVLPILRPLRLLRLITLLTLLQRAAGTRLRGQVAVYVIGSTTVLVGVASLAMLEAERSAPGAGITSYGQALWWAIVTITTVGYGDKIPVSDTGHFIAVALMIAGIALLGTVTAWLASWLVDRVADDNAESDAVTKAELSALTEEVAALRTALERVLPYLPGAAAESPASAASAGTAGSAAPAGTNRATHSM
jgi:voltage-gated potassium channel